MTRVIFRLKRWWPPDLPREYQTDLYEEIKAGSKKSEIRDSSDFWASRLLNEKGLEKFTENRIGLRKLAFHEDLVKASRAWFTVGYPKGQVPRLEADITVVLYFPEGEQFEIRFENVVEVLE